MGQDDRDDRYSDDGTDPDQDAGQIRYDGPVRAARQPRARRGPRVPFATAAVLAAAVVILIGVAWLLSGDDDPPPPPPATSLATGATGAEGVARVPAEPAGEEPAAGEAKAEEPPAPAPVSVAAARPPVRPTPPPAEPTRGSSAASSTLTPPPSSTATSAGAVGDLVRRGDLTGACLQGNVLAQEAARQGQYTVQVLSVTDPEGVRRAFDKVRDERLVVITVSSPKGPVYRLLWGFHESVEAARKEAGSCPDYFPRSSSWPYTPTVATALTPIRR